MIGEHQLRQTRSLIREAAPAEVDVIADRGTPTEADAITSGSTSRGGHDQGATTA